MHRRELLSILAGAAVAPAAAPAVLRGRYRLFAQFADEYSARTIRLMQESPVVDMLCQFAFPDNREEGTPRAEQWLHNPNTFTAEDFAVFRSSGVKTLALGTGVDTYEGMLRFMAAWNGFIASRSEWFTRVDDVEDLRSTRPDGRVGIMITTQVSEHFRSVGRPQTKATASPRRPSAAGSSATATRWTARGRRMQRTAPSCIRKTSRRKRSPPASA
jgi:hypothetical protein